MTPGLAQSREQLPWLYYPESDRVIINAHNFNPPPSGPVLSSALAAYIAETRSGTTLTDSSGNGLDGTLLGTGSYSLISGHATRYGLSFSGSQYGAVGTTAGLLNYSLPFSVSAWCNWTFSGLRFICGNRQGATGFQFRTNGASFELVPYGGSTLAVTLSGAQIAAGWHHAAVVCAASSTILYWDGVQVAANAATVAAASNAAAPMGLWAAETGSAVESYSTGTGTGADLIFWQHDLTPTEITWLADAANGFLP